jgi:hypothetical protein
MHSVEQILRGIKQPHKIAREINRICHTRGGKYRQNPRGINFLEEDWDNLIILDACRHDTFREYSDLPGRLETKYSLGGSTKEFIRANFKNKKLHDVVYLGANVWFLKLKDIINSEIHHFVDLQNGDYDVEWVDEKLQVVTPETVTRHAKRLHDEYPNKRLIIHYLQPHHPFIGPTGTKYLSHQSRSLSKVIQAADGKVTREIVWKAYVENLELVLEEVEELLPNLKGQSVITADHGEMIGDRHSFIPIRDYGHPEGIYNEVTVKVPWNVIDSAERKEIIPEKPTQDNQMDEDIIDERLEDLGYVV